MIYIAANDFSLNMLNINGPVELEVFPLTQLKDYDVADFLRKKEYVSAIGCKEIADILTNMLKLEIECKRTTVEIGRNDMLIVAQYRGPRLEEGATKLPDGAEIKFYMVR